MFEGFELTTIDTGEAQIRVRHGGSGPPLLLIHGNPQTHVMWHKIAPRLAQDFTVVATDLRGYGDSSKPDYTPDHAPYSKRAMARDQVEVMRQLGFERFNLAGHDRGARCAYRLTIDHPERVEKLAVLDIVPTYEAYARTTKEYALRTWHWFFLAQPADFPERAINRAPDVFFERRPTAFFTPEARAEYWRCYQNPDTIRAICEDYRAGVTLDCEHDLADRGKQPIKCPVLVLWGDKGWRDMGWDFLEIWRQYATDVRGRGLESGHFLAEEVPDETYAELAAFFKS
ncbi:MAG: alpha/beta hydrolase [Chloroflexota bacterium]